MARELGALAVAAVALGACGSGASTTGGAGTGGGAGTLGGAGTNGGAAGTGAAGTVGAAGTGAAGTMGAAGTGAAGTVGAAGTGAAGTMGAAGTGAAGTAGGAGSGGAGTTGAAGTGPFTLTSTAFTAGMEIPLLYKCDKVTPVGMNQSPPLTWTPGPAGTKSYAVILNHVGGGDHWAIWDIPLGTTSLPQNIDHTGMPAAPSGAKQSVTNLDGFMGNGYLGPCPQAQNARQMYTFTVFALNVTTLAGVTPTSSTTTAQAAIKAAMVAGGSATLVGTQIRM